jgi:hypothetical protein
VKYDKLRLEKMLSSFHGARAQLQRLAMMDAQEFLSDPDKIASAKYN